MAGPRAGHVSAAGASVRPAPEHALLPPAAPRSTPAPRDAAVAPEPASVLAPHHPADAAFEEAYQYQHAALLSWLRSRTRDQFVAEELCQEAFARLLGQMRTGGLPDSLPAWLRTIGRNLYVSRLRRDRVAGRKAPPGAASASGDPTLEAALEHERIGVAWVALGGLPAPEREMILKALRGSTAPQMAALLGISPGAARTRLHRARRQLRSAMVAHPGPAHGAT